MAAPTAPASMDDFNSQAASFVQKAKAAGKSNTAIANTLKFMYGMTQENIDNTQMTPYEASVDKLNRDKFNADQLDKDKGTSEDWQIVEDEKGKKYWVNRKTQEKKEFSDFGTVDDNDIPDKSTATTTPNKNVGYNSAGEGIMSLDPAAFEKNYAAIKAGQSVPAGASASVAPNASMSTQRPLTAEEMLKNVPGSNLMSSLQSAFTPSYGSQMSTNKGVAWVPYKWNITS